MCTCIDNIRASYSEVKRETSRVARRSFQKPVEAGDNAQVSVDDFLDAINVITRELHQVTTSVNDLVEVVRINFCQITPQEARELKNAVAAQEIAEVSSVCWYGNCGKAL